MALVRTDGSILPDEITAEISADEARNQLAQSNTAIAPHVAVVVTVEDDIDALAPVVDRIPNLKLRFDHFKDGRHFTNAVALRRQGYAGDLRASGDVLPDQALYLARSGFSSIDVPESFKADDFAYTLKAYSVAYQSAIAGRLAEIQRIRATAPSLAAE